MMKKAVILSILSLSSLASAAPRWQLSMTDVRSGESRTLDLGHDGHTAWAGAFECKYGPDLGEHRTMACGLRGHSPIVSLSSVCARGGSVTLTDGMSIYRLVLSCAR